MSKGLAPTLGESARNKGTQRHEFAARCRQGVRHGATNGTDFPPDSGIRRTAQSTTYFASDHGERKTPCVGRRFIAGWNFGPLISLCLRFTIRAGGNSEQLNY